MRTPSSNAGAGPRSPSTSTSPSRWQSARAGEHTGEQLAAVLKALATAEHLLFRDLPGRRHLPA
ncbi:hypothetical protein [Kitasatospora sp. NPDC056531]|uniref:hypothetical protein n=1 Tax=Kitasatospora sp. NPDC056531 TaxID=3345856 RepID=UPI00367BC4E0